MKVKWYGHSTFVIGGDAGVRLITDPVAPGCYDNALKYSPVKEECDVVLQSHQHPDHAGAEDLPGRPTVVAGVGLHEVAGITFKGVGTYHDERQGRERGSNTAFAFELEGARIVFLGDLGHVLSEEQAAALGPADVLFVPVGGYFTIDARGAEEVARQLEARVIFPMHYKTPACGFPIAPVDEFIRGKTGVVRVGAAEVNADAAFLAEPKIVLLDYVK